MSRVLVDRSSRWSASCCSASLSRAAGGDFRFVLGPWRWMLIVYAYDEVEDTVAVVTIQDGRSSTAATSGR